MTNAERQESLANARRACLLLAEYAVGENMLILGEPQREAIACLLEEFGRLDALEQRLAKRSRQNGRLGGRPKSPNPSAAALAKRRSRAKQKA